MAGEFEEASEETIERLLELARTGKLTSDHLQDMAKSSQVANKALYQAGESAGKLAKGTGSFLMNVAGGNTQLSSMKTMVGAAGDAIAGGLSAAGDALSAIPIFGKVFEGAAKFAAKAAHALAQATNVAVDRIQATYEAFTEVSQQGLIGAEGMSGLRREMDRAQVPLEQFAKMLSKNAHDMAYFSGSALKGGKQFSQVIGRMQDGTGLPLRRLGFSIEEIGDTVVDFQKTYQRLGILQKMNTDELAKSTIKYGKELDLVAKLTGQSRREAQKNREALMADTRFRAWQQQQESKIGIERTMAIADFIGGIKKLSPTMSEGIKDLFASGGVATTDAGRRLIQQGMGPVIEDIKKQMMSSTVDQAEAQAKAQRMLFEEALKNRDKFRDLSAIIGEFGVGIPYQEMADLAKAVGLSDKEIQNLRKAQKSQTGGQDQLTDSITHTIQELSRLQVNLDKLVTSTNFLPKAMDAFASTMNSVVIWLREKVLGESAEDIKKGQEIQRRQSEAAKIGVKTEVVNTGQGAELNIAGGEYRVAVLKRAAINSEIAKIEEQHLKNGIWANEKQKEIHERLVAERNLKDSQIDFMRKNDATFRQNLRTSLVAKLSTGKQRKVVAGQKVRKFLKEQGWSDQEIINAPIETVVQIGNILDRYEGQVQLSGTRGANLVAPESFKKEIATVKSHAGEYFQYNEQKRLVQEEIERARETGGGIDRSEKANLEKMIEELRGIGHRLDRLNDNTTNLEERARETNRQLKINGS